jgi:hypothetical protein
MEMWINVQEMYREFLSAGIIRMCGRRSVAGNVSVIGITYADPTDGSPLLPTEELWR